MSLQFCSAEADTIPRVNASARIPYVVGITGHRDCDPACAGSMKAGFLALLGELAAAMPHSPILLLSGIAAGADQLAASWALEWAQSQPSLGDGTRRLSLVAVLPMPLQDYLADFASDPGGHAQVESLMSRAAFVVTLPSVGTEEIDRDASYSQLGSFLAEQSQMLIAFWDGNRTLKRGGTYHVIQKCVREDADAAALDMPFHRRRHLLVSPNEVDVRVVRVRRAEGGERVGGEPRERAISIPPDEQDGHADYRAHLDAINRRIKIRDGAAVASAPRNVVGRRFAAVDSMAGGMKRVFLRHVTALSVLSVIAVLCFQLFSFNNREGWAAISYVALTSAVLAWFLVLRHFSSVEWIFVYSRSVAEAMRVQLAWADSGVASRVSDQYMSRRSLDVGVLRRLVGAATIDTFADGVIRASAVNEAAARAWIDDQRGYMRTRINGSGNSRSVAAALSSAVLSVVRFIVRIHWILVPVTVAVLAWLAIRGNAAGGITVERLLPLGAFLIGTILFLKSGVEYHDNTVLSREDIERFRRMLPVYDRASDLIGRASNDADRRRILTALGKEAIDENAEWFVKHTDALKLPTVG